MGRTRSLASAKVAVSRRSLPVGRLLRRLFTYTSACALFFLAVFPLIWMLSTALKPKPEIFAWPPYLLPAAPTVENFEQLFEVTRFLIHFKNSIWVAGATTLLNIVVGVMAAYSITRFHFPGREQFANFILLTYMFPPIVLLVPFFIVFKALGLIDSHLGLVLAYTAISLPFTIWLLRDFFEGLPIDLEEAALTDGANRAQAVAFVVVPLALPGVIATGIFTFIVAWNDYLFARVMIASEDLKTLPVSVQDLQLVAVVDWGMIMAAGVMIVLPALALFLVLQRFLMAGWGAGGVRG